MSDHAKTLLEIRFPGMIDHPRYARSRLAILVLATAAAIYPRPLASIATDPVDLTGVWSAPAQTLEDEIWRFEDFACFLGCPTSVYDYARALFSDPGNLENDYSQLHRQVLIRRSQTVLGALTPAALERRKQFDPADDPAIRCEPYGLVRQATLSPVPIEITQSADNVTIRYELWEAVRTVFLDGRPPENEPTRLGHSTGRYENGELVVETTSILENLYSPDAGAFHSDALRTVERYRVSEKGERLDLEMTLIDDVMLKQPLTYRTAWRRTPEAQILPDRCVTLDRSEP